MTLKEYNQQYYLTTNKERLMKKIVCPLCNCELYYCNKSHHNKSKKHQLLVSMNAENKKHQALRMPK
jgi:uncharacterized protein YbaR (Trm112 family)